MKELLKKIEQAKSTMGFVEKKETNPFFKSKYFDINGLIDHVRPHFTENGLLLLQPIIDGEVKSQIFDLETGEFVHSSIKLPELSDPQKLGSCITYYRRYTLQSLLGMQAEDNDGNSTSKPTLIPNSKEWKQAVKYLAGSGTIEAIRKKYIIESEEQLLSDAIG